MNKKIKADLSDNCVFLYIKIKYKLLKTPKNITINAIAPDGIIEGIEDHKYKWCMGVQWHPEFLISSYDEKIYNSFISACK